MSTTMSFDIIHLSSPVIYSGFVYILQNYIHPCPHDYFMKLFRYHHNLFLSGLSCVMFLMISIGNYQTGKFESTQALLCSPYGNNWMANTGASLFLWSKYLEWFDTMFLHLSGKPISMLQYTHHMSTACLMYLNFIDYLSPHMYIFMGSNCFVHIWMYYYFAEPRGWIHKYRQYITASQILQHIVCLYTIYVTQQMGCEQNKYGNISGFFMYSMYLFYFVGFYANKYLASSKYLI